MAETKDAVAYLIKNYPSELRGELSNARVTKMLYLADWHHTLNYSRQITPIKWYFDNYGPYVDDVRECARRFADVFGTAVEENFYGEKKLRLFLRSESVEPALLASERNSIDHVIAETKDLYWDRFIKLVYSTHPIASSERYTFLDLNDKALQYKRAKVA